MDFSGVHALEFRRLIEEKGRAPACREIGLPCDSHEQSIAIVQAYVYSLLRMRRMAAAGVMLWGERLFNPRPASVKMVWRALERDAKVMIPGGSSVGKTYTGICWTLLDWWCDPEFTTVKIISTTGGHTKANSFGTLKMLCRQAIVPMPGVLRAESISFTESDNRACISIVRIKEGEDNSEVLQGFHPLPRPQPHPIYGESSRVRAVLDEAEGISSGVWRGIDNMFGSRHGEYSVKGFAFLNPKDVSARPAQLMEPAGGWGEFDVETGVKGKDTWISRMGWRVVRIDPKKTENVTQRKTIYPGLQTYEGYRDYEKEQDGNSLTYYIFGRGCYPPEGAVSTVVTQRVLNQMRGEFIFVGPTINVAGADIAIDGRDRAIYCFGRMGRANAMVRHEVNAETGEIKKVTVKFPEERKCIQADQFFSLPKGSPKIVGDSIKAASIRLGVAPEWCMSDETGNGGPVVNYLRIDDVWSPQVRGIDFGKNPTKVKILEQDKESPEELYEGIHTEVWFAVAKLGENGYLAIAPSVRSEDLERELVGRRYKISAGKKHGLVVEKKEIYKSRLGVSPDYADAFTIFVHCARTGGDVVGSMTGRAIKAEQEEPSVLDKPEWFHEEFDRFSTI